MTAPQFAYDDVVRVRPTAELVSRVGHRAWVVGIFAEPRPGAYFERFPRGVVYTVEFEDGSSAEIHEGDLDSCE